MLRSKVDTWVPSIVLHVIIIIVVVILRQSLSQSPELMDLARLANE